MLSGRAGIFDRSGIAPQARPGRRKRALQPCWPAPIQIGASPRAGKLAVTLVVDVKVGLNWRDMQ